MLVLTNVSGTERLEDRVTETSIRTAAGEVGSNQC